MATIEGLGLAEPSTITKSLAVVPITRNSSVTYHEVQLIGSPNSTTLLALAEVMGTDPVSSVMGLVVRQPRPVLQTFASTAGTDTATSLVSSQAGSKAYVSAFMVTSTEAGPVNCGFYAGASLLWPLTIWSEGGIINVSQQVPYPSYLFAGSTGAALTFNVASSGAYRVAITYSTGA